MRTAADGTSESKEPKRKRVTLRMKVAMATEALLLKAIVDLKEQAPVADNWKQTADTNVKVILYLRNAVSAPWSNLLTLTDTETRAYMHAPKHTIDFFVRNQL